MLQLTSWLTCPVKMVQVAVLVALGLQSTSQELESFSLTEAYQSAEANFPLVKQKLLFKETEQLLVKNLQTMLLPQLSLSGQASYQSDVTRVDIPIPGVKVPSQQKDQYRVVAELSQLIYDGGQLSAQKNLQLLNTSLDESRLEIDIYQFKQRISQLFFNILYQDALLKQTGLLIQDIQTGISKVTPQVEQALILRSNLLVLEVQLLQNRQREIEINAMRKGLTDALALLTNRPVGERTRFLMPSPVQQNDSAIHRPELKFFQQQTSASEAQLKLIDSRVRPRISFFVQGGYGRPALNLLSDKFEPYYITGLRFNWSISSLYNKAREKQLVDISNQSVTLQTENFLLSTKTQLKQMSAEIAKYRELVATDRQIIDLRNRITESAKMQLENAVITSNDYLREINAADLARQALVTHQLQLLQAEISYQVTTGKF
jgi:outer membrane protein TolC